MKKNDYGGVRILLAMENLIIRQGLQNALQTTGFSRAIEVTSVERMIATLMEARFDLILASSDLGAEPISPFLAQLRQGMLVHHPLPVILTFLASAEHDYVRKAIDCGPDDLLQLPIVPKQLLQRIQLLGEKRKTFVVTSDYVGPDRRQGVRPGSMPVPVFDVPNPLAMKMAKKSDEEVKAAIDVASDRLRAMRLARYAFELQWLLRAIRALFEQSAKDLGKLISFCERIKTLLCGLPRLMTEGLPPPLSPLVERLETGCNILIKNGLSADATIVQGLSKLIVTLVVAVRDTLPPDLADTVGLAPAAAT